MLKKLLTLATFVVAGATGTMLHAQTDVTSTYLTNADFSSVENWTAYVSSQFRDYGNGLIGTYNVRFSPATVDETHTSSEYCLGFEVRWSSNYASYNQTTSELPAGVYKLTYDVENVNEGTISKTYDNLFYVQIGDTKYSDSSTEWMMKGKSSWTSHTINFTVTDPTTAVISLGYGTGNNNISADQTPAIYVSHLKLTWTDPLAGSRNNWKEALDVAKAAVENTDYANVKGEELTALNAEIGKTEPTTIDGYTEATTALTNATSIFTGAKAAYDAFETAKTETTPDLAYAATAKKTALTETKNTTATSAEDATAKTAAITKALRAYYESHALAEGVDGAVNMSDRITNATEPKNNNGWTWTGSKNNPKSNESWTDADGTNNHSYFDGGDWGANSWTTTMKQTVSLPAGKFLLTAKGRAATNTTFTMAVGESSVDLPHVSSVGNVFNRGWGDASVEFETDGSDVEILVTASSNTLHEWFSVSDFRLVRLELYTEMAKAEDYEALNAAIAAAEAKTLGFETGEYAPYNNVETIEALATAKALDQTAENSKDEVLALTSALGVWNLNNGEVDGIYNGDLNASVPNATSGVNVDMPGWTSVQGMRLVIGDAATDPGLEYTSAKKALFSWGGTTLTYGEKTGYTLPLKANTVYEVTYLISAWRDGDFPTYTSVNVGGKIYEKYMTVPGKINDAEGNPFKQMTFKFVTGEAGDYVVKLYGNKHFVVSDISLRKVATERFNGTTIAATDKYGTFISPIARELPTGLKAYTVDGVEENGTTLTLTSVDAIAANTPVVLENTTDAAITLEAKEGQSLATEETYKTGLLTGVLALNGILAPANSYVLQNQDNVVAFYKVYEDATAAITVPAYRAYLTAPSTATGANVRGFFFPESGDATGIAGIEALTSGNYDAIYTAGGVKVNSLQKGLNIVVKDGKSYKIFVK